MVVVSRREHSAAHLTGKDQTGRENYAACIFPKKFHEVIRRVSALCGKVLGLLSFMMARCSWQTLPSQHLLLGLLP